MPEVSLQSSVCKSCLLSSITYRCRLDKFLSTRYKLIKLDFQALFDWMKDEYLSRRTVIKKYIIHRLEFCIKRKVTNTSKN